MPLSMSARKSVVLVGGMHWLALHVFRKADLGRIGIVVDDVARDFFVRLDGSGVREGFERQQAATPRDDRVFAAFVLAHDERLQRTMRGDGGR
jgi:hypothetical protein